MSEVLLVRQQFAHWWILKRAAFYKTLSLAFLAIVALSLLKYYSQSLGQHIVPLEEIKIQGGSSHSRAAAVTLLQEIRGSNLMAVDIRHWREKLQALSGIRRAQLTRQLPHTLQVVLESSQPLARRVDGSLIDGEGRFFVGSVDKVLPVFRADASRMKEMVAFYHRANTLLPDGIVQLELDAQGQWQAFLTNGVLLRLGRQPLAQLRRYIRYAPLLQRRLPTLREIDMRYRRGFAVQLHKS